MTRRGWLAIKAELDTLVRSERPKLVETVAWAASNGDRSENGDYIYGKKRLREIDRASASSSSVSRTPAWSTRGAAEPDQVFFGATVVISDDEGETEQTYQIVGVDEANASEGLISWISPLARALLKAREGDVVRFASPSGLREIEVLEIRYFDAGRLAAASPSSREGEKLLAPCEIQPRSPSPAAQGAPSSAGASAALPGDAPHPRRAARGRCGIYQAQPGHSPGHTAIRRQAVGGSVSTSRQRETAPAVTGSPHAQGDPRPFLTRQLKFPIAWPMSRMTSRRRSLPGSVRSRARLVQLGNSNARTNEIGQSAWIDGNRLGSRPCRAGCCILGTSHGQLVDSEMRRVNDVVTATDSVFKHFYGLQSSGAMSRDEAQQRALELLRNLRFEDGKNYVFVFDSHATAPARR